MAILDSELNIPNYSIVRLDRNGHGGGVAIYMFSIKVLLLGPEDLELIQCCFTIVRQETFVVYIGVFYTDNCATLITN